VDAIRLPTQIGDLARYPRMEKTLRLFHAGRYLLLMVCKAPPLAREGLECGWWLPQRISPSLALSGQSNRARVCPLLDKNRHWAELALNELAVVNPQNRPAAAVR
jgi:hypothetical protein